MASNDASALRRTTAHFVHEWPSSRVIFGAGRVSDVAAEVARLGTQAMVINDPAALPTAQQVVDDLGTAVRARVTDVIQHVPVASVEAATMMAERAEIDVIVCIGGGSATGLAKAIVRTLELPIVAVPTTYAGSEMTSIWGLTEDGKKTTGRAERVRPRTVVYDPELTVGLPVALSVTSGINAIAHCVEALYAPGVSPLTTLAAAEGVRAMAAALPSLVIEPGDVDAREFDPDEHFQLPDLLGKGGLGDVQVLGGAAEVQLVGDSQEVAQMAKLDPGIHTSSLLIRRPMCIGLMVRMGRRLVGNHVTPQKAARCRLSLPPS